MTDPKKTDDEIEIDALEMEDEPAGSEPSAAQPEPPAAPPLPTRAGPASALRAPSGAVRPPLPPLPRKAPPPLGPVAPPAARESPPARPPPPLPLPRIGTGLRGPTPLPPRSPLRAPTPLPVSHPEVPRPPGLRARVSVPPAQAPRVAPKAPEPEAPMELEGLDLELDAVPSEEAPASSPSAVDPAPPPEPVAMEPAAVEPPVGPEPGPAAPPPVPVGPAELWESSEVDRAIDFLDAVSLDPPDALEGRRAPPLSRAGSAPPEAPAPPAAPERSNAGFLDFGDLALGDDEIAFEPVAPGGLSRPSAGPPALPGSEGPPAGEEAQTVAVSVPPPVSAPPPVSEADLSFDDDLLFAEEPQAPSSPPVVLESADADVSLDFEVDEGGPSLFVEAGDGDDDADEDSVLFLDEEAEVDLGPAGPAADDRGAMLAAAVTSRHRGIEGLDRMFASDARAEARARAELLVEEAATCDSYTLAADWLSLAADLYEGVLADRGRARQLADQARALAPECLHATRVLRRIALQEGELAAALALCDDELAQPLGPEESRQLLLLAAELAARVRPEAAPGYWRRLGEAPGVLGPLATLFAGAATHDEAEVLASLEAWAAQSAGELAASIDVARARRVEGVAGDAAIHALRDAVGRDSSDAGAWLSMARIGFSRANAEVFREGLQGLSRSGAGGVLSVASDALGRALSGVLGEPIDPTPVDDPGVAGWLVAHAQRDAEVDPGPQVARGLQGPEAGRSAWALWSADQPLGDDPLGRFESLRRASVGGDVPGAAAAFVEGEAAGLIEAALRAVAGAVDAAEAEALARSEAAPAGLRGALLASVGDLDAVDALHADNAPGAPGLVGLDVFERVLWAGPQAAALEALRGADSGAMASDSVAGLGLVRLRGRALPSVEDAAGALWAEARGAADERRAAGQRMVGAALAAGTTVPGAGPAARWAAERLTGDMAAAELAALYALRGGIEPGEGAALLARASEGEGTARRLAEVRAALRRATEDADAASDMLWGAWQRLPRDASLGSLVLRASGGPSERSVAVLRVLADASYAAGPEAGAAGVAVGQLLATTLEELGRYAEAAQVVARARTQALGDLSLEVAEERLWLRAGMFAEVAERAFDQLKAAPDNEACIVAYEKLAELDRTYRGDVASSVLSFQAILELSPGHMASLRTLERYFTEQGRTAELLDIYDRLVRYAEDPADALAFAHAGARLAEREGDGEPEVAAEFWRVVLGRDVFDRRLLLGLDAETRRLGDLEGFAGVQVRLASLATDDLERATALMRAGEAFEAIGDEARAREAYEAAGAVELVHVGSLHAVAEVRLRAGETVSAAEALETAGRAHRVIAHAVSALHQAAVLWRAADDRGRALTVAQEALGLDPRHDPSFVLALELLTEGGDAAGELAQLEARLEVEAEAGDPVALATWHARAAVLARELGDPERALGHWRSVSTLEPERLDALRALVVLFPEGEDWAGAADAMIRLAKATPDPAERVEMLFGLGDVFERRLEDTRRAEAAWRRALQYAPDDRRILARLADLYAVTGEAERQAEALVALIPRTAVGAERTALQLRLAAVLESGLGDMARAEHTLEAARREAPAELSVLRALTQFHGRRGSPQAAQVLLDRAATELRRSLDRDPCNLDALGRLAEVLSLRGRDDGARVVASVGWALAPSPEAVPEALRGHSPDGVVAGLGASALQSGALDLLSPPAISGALREVLSRTARVIDPLVPFDPQPWAARPLGNRPHALRGTIDDWAERYNLGPVSVLLCGALNERCLPVYRSPATILLAADAADDVPGRAAVARAMTLMALSLSLPLRMTQEDFSLTLAALFRQFEPMYRGNVDPARLDELARRMTRAMPRDLHAEAAPFAYEALNRGSLDAEAIHAGALEFGDRVALLASGDLSGALSLLGEGRSPPRAVAEVPVAGRLVRVALSDRFLDARQIAGTDPLPAAS